MSTGLCSTRPFVSGVFYRDVLRVRQFAACVDALLLSVTASRSLVRPAVPPCDYASICWGTLGLFPLFGCHEQYRYDDSSTSFHENVCSLLLGVHLAVESLGAMVTPRLTFGGTARLVPKVAAPFHSPTRRLHFSVLTDLGSFLIYSRLVWWKCRGSWGGGCEGREAGQSHGGHRGFERL